MRKLPIGIQSFQNLRQDDYLYIDKTQYIDQLVQMGKSYFLSRPRRFGKSLLISTLEAYFQGKKELFHGLYIEEKENQKGKNAWTEYPVIRFSLAGGSFNQENGLSDLLNGFIQDAAQKYQLSPDLFADMETLPRKFRALIERLYYKTGKPVVVLVDECDKPVIEPMFDNPEQEVRNRRELQGFFGVLKDEDEYLKFVFMTGVTKLRNDSVFSDWNNLWDISLMKPYAGICGITQEELEENFPDEIQLLADNNDLSRQECLEQLRTSYGGYHFCPEGEEVCNPAALLTAFWQREFCTGWFETGTPTFLVRKVKRTAYPAVNLTEGIDVGQQSLTDLRSDNENLIPFLYQSGYLTIRGYDRDYHLYHLAFPNQDVEESYRRVLSGYFQGGNSQVPGLD